MDYSIDKIYDKINNLIKGEEKIDFIYNDKNLYLEFILAKEGTYAIDYQTAHNQDLKASDFLYGLSRMKSLDNEKFRIITWFKIKSKRIKKKFEIVSIELNETKDSVLVNLK